MDVSMIYIPLLFFQFCALNSSPTCELQQPMEQPASFLGDHQDNKNAVVLLLMVKIPVNKGMNYQPQLVNWCRILLLNSIHTNQKLMTWLVGLPRVEYAQGDHWTSKERLKNLGNMINEWCFEKKNMTDKHLEMLPVHPKKKSKNW